MEQAQVNQAEEDLKTDTPLEETSPTSTTDAMQAIKKQYFAPNELPAAHDVITAISELCNPVLNFKAEEGIPDNYGIAIIPTNQRIKDANDKPTTIVIGCSICAIPDPSLVTASEEGQAWIRKNTIDAFIAQCANLARPRQGIASDSILPFSVSDFITTNRSGSTSMTATFNKLASDYVKLLKKAPKFALITNKMLGQVLQSASFAEQCYPTIPAEQWDGLIGKMIEKSKGLDLATDGLQLWLDERYTTTSIVEEDDDSDLSELLA